jgi:hypothetical protein
MAVLLMAAALLAVGLVVFWMEPLFVLSAIERLTPNIIYRVRTHRPVVVLLDSSCGLNPQAGTIFLGRGVSNYSEVVME